MDPLPEPVDYRDAAGTDPRLAASGRDSPSKAYAPSVGGAAVSSTGGATVETAGVGASNACSPDSVLAAAEEAVHECTAGELGRFRNAFSESAWAWDTDGAVSAARARMPAEM
jgi:hypothetical protein